MARRYSREAFNEPPDGHTPAGTPYWEFQKKEKNKTKTFRLFGYLPVYPDAAPIIPPEDDITPQVEDEENDGTDDPAD